MKSSDLKLGTYIECGIENDDKDSKFKVGDHVGILKYKNISAKGHTPNWSEEIFPIKKSKNAVPWTCSIIDLKGEEIVEHLMKRSSRRPVNKN